MDTVFHRAVPFFFRVILHKFLRANLYITYELLESGPNQWKFAKIYAIILNEKKYFSKMFNFSRRNVK